MLLCFLSIDMFVLFTRYSLRYLSLKLDFLFVSEVRFLKFSCAYFITVGHSNFNSNANFNLNSNFY